MVDIDGVLEHDKAILVERLNSGLEVVRANLLGSKLFRSQLNELGFGYLVVCHVAPSSGIFSGEMMRRI